MAFTWELGIFYFYGPSSTLLLSSSESIKSILLFGEPEPRSILPTSAYKFLVGVSGMASSISPVLRPYLPSIITSMLSLLLPAEMFEKPLSLSSLVYLSKYLV